jgi:hypothetical protein
MPLNISSFAHAFEMFYRPCLIAISLVSADVLLTLHLPEAPRQAHSYLTKLRLNYSVAHSSITGEISPAHSSLFSAAIAFEVYFRI